MRVGLLSDTHIPEVRKVLPPQVKEAFRNVDLILHAGDVFDVSVLNELERLAPVLAAEGDDDSFTISKDSRMKERHLLTLEGVTILLIHIGPWGPPLDSEHTSDPVGSEHHIIVQHKKTPDIIVCGHAHRPRVQKINGVFVVNPGSPTFPEYKLQLGTVGFLTVAAGKAKVQIVQLQ